MIASPKTRILILGGGFAGLHAAMHLDDTLARDPDIEISLVNRDNKLGRYAENKLAERGVEIRVNTRVTGVTETA